MKHIINGLSFKTDKELQDYAKSILYQGEIGELLFGEQFEFMLDYFAKNHAEWEQKKSVGVARIRRVKEPNYGKFRGFRIERIDGSSTDISYILANIKRKDYVREFKLALRRIVEPQILIFKTAQFEGQESLTCPLTNDKIYFENCHADHFNPTFEELVKNFVAKHEITDFQILIAPSKDDQTWVELANVEVATLWFEFHLQHANLRLLSPLANLSLAKRDS